MIIWVKKEAAYANCDQRAAILTIGDEGLLLVQLQGTGKKKIISLSDVIGIEIKDVILRFAVTGWSLSKCESLIEEEKKKKKKLWLLRIIDCDKISETIVRAENIREARELASSSPRTELRNLWLSPLFSTCDELKIEGEAEVLVDLPFSKK